MCTVLRITITGVTNGQKRKEQKPTLNFDGTEYDIEGMSDEQKTMVNHIADLDRKVSSSEFNLTQLQVGRQSFVDMLRTSLTADEEESE